MAPNHQEIRGVLHLARGRDNYNLTRIPPSPALAPYIERYWLVGWDLRGREPQVQENIPHPNVHLVIEQGRSEIVGVVTRRYTRILEGEGRVIGVKFHPGGFYPFLKKPITSLTDQTLPPAHLFGAAFNDLENAVLSGATHAEQVHHLERFLKAQQPDRAGVTDEVRLATEITHWIAAHPEVTKVDQIADHFAVSKRRLQRLFQKFVGIGPKWVIKKYRLHEALAQCETAPPNWTDLAYTLGYSDQAHFIKDFKALTGHTPTAYLRRNQHPRD
ncbi:helix-turn-helix domain-containing protein [Acanthopleuribacter pedis]|uniref:Helix-turn-helix transcriptional regulator n=1 Tax=Acanthopleuribacter pedis TaxID=442870 RepID=A0A8J7U3J4_9BACT|nr:AraC family transcriptional regulator [Acanthopleuribacter pedis]MBO1317316.1 helix-turn-helix transcriptional regulator [Acanthopleuribacter pedis]MBO1318623.1 helix-turn-helix transcriptional regulator [Acanthopleuribacter pedis]